MAVDSRNQVVEEFCSTAASPASNTSNATQAPQNTGSAPNSNKLSGAAIAGIAVGCVAILDALAGIISWLLVRRKKDADETGLNGAASFSLMGMQDNPDTTSSSNHVSQDMYNKPELYGRPVRFSSPAVWAQELPT